ncbi:helix-turn-helix transcriptional regulator [Halobacillus sp. A5]|uniref:helix-turn-helix transcriptional regulator n=1 Tax=Halobacillus sp. A5 TaxID=2880263 RepID=UPI0020A655DE|nr:helix-turn-helix transcriptional regulator [Halobacillus sp. A5]MCP3025984.1 helix-turn-helix transcriptional regulator [Halobacillus sp. A5]
MECNLNEWIAKRGFKKKWVAAQIGVSSEVMSRWVNGKSIPSLENALKLAEILNCKVEDLWKIKKSSPNESS